MDIKLFSLCKQEVPESEMGKKCIEQCVNSVFAESTEFTAFSSQKRMLLAISQSLLAADIVIVAVQSNMYHATKKLLCGILDIELEENAEAVAALVPKFENGSIRQNIFDANITFPVGCEVFPTDNGLNSGFALTSGGQHLIYMPIEAPKAEEIVFGSLYDYLSELGDGETAENAMETRRKAILERTLGKLSENSVKVAIGSKICGDYLTSVVDEESMKVCAVIDNDFAEKSESENEDRYYINAARELRDRHIAQYGVAFSEILADEEGGYILAAIADESGTNVVRMNAGDGENSEMLYKSAVDKIMLMLYDYNELVDAADESMISDKADKALRKAVASTAGLVIGAAAVIGLLVSWFS